MQAPPKPFFALFAFYAAQCLATDDVQTLEEVLVTAPQELDLGSYALLTHLRGYDGVRGRHAYVDRREEQGVDRQRRGP
jgi:hypothetical protein